MRFIFDKLNIEKLKSIFTGRPVSQGRRTVYYKSSKAPGARKVYRAEKFRLIKFASIACAAVVSVVVVTSVLGSQGKVSYGGGKATNSNINIADAAGDSYAADTAASGKQIKNSAPEEIRSANASNEITLAAQPENAAAQNGVPQGGSAANQQSAVQPQSGQADAGTNADSASMSNETGQAEASQQQEPVVLDVAPEKQSEDTKKLQERLIELNYMDSDDPTGYYGSVTAEAVGFFQRKHDLPRDGVAGAETQALLFSDEAKPYTVTLEATGPDVENIQERLEELGYPVEVTGYFGAVTQNVVGYFQRMNGLEDDGSVGQYTKELLFSENAVPAIEEAAAEEESSGGGSSENSGEEGSSGNSESSGGSGGSSSAPDVSNKGGVEGLIEYAKTLMGKPYVRGGKGPDVFDCSGFVYYALNQSGYSIGYMTSGGWGSSGYTTIGSMSDLQRGDIVCFNGHVGIYLGDGDMIDSRPSAGGVVITEDIFNTSYWTRNFKSGKRIF